MYFTIEDGQDNCLDRTLNANEAIRICNNMTNAKEVFKFTDNDELVECIYRLKE